MTETQVSPISQLLHTLGITREDLNKRSDQMRQFLTADDAMASRALERDNSYRPSSGSDIRSGSRSVGSSSSLARSLSRASSSSLRDGTPPATPVKSEPHEGGIPHRRMDSMEMVLERQRRQRKSRRGRERESAKVIPHPPSPSPSSASQSGVNLDSFMQSRDDLTLPSAVDSQSADNVSTVTDDLPPVTPQKNKYYREHTNLRSSSQPSKDTPCKTETLTPTQPLTQPVPQSQSLPQYYAYPGYIGYAHYLPMTYRPAQASSSSFSDPVTPQPQRIQHPLRKMAASPIPSYSPPPASSPVSSPPRFNMVSSPGPMGPPPEEEEYENLPYKLPPGPYSPNKPDLSYAALVGRAVLSSPDHRLTLQEIYDWITIVYPHYKRGETTWMNSIRHVLSTTMCFRKVPRDRSVGRTLWAIWDEDLECFKGGGFRKQLCKDYANANEIKEKQAGASKGKPRVRKRADDDDGMDTRKPKRTKKDSTTVNVSVASSTQSLFKGPTPLSSHPLFPPTRPTPHHQPYYESCMPQPQVLPAEIIFPPLPATAAFNRVVNTGASSIRGDTQGTESRISTPAYSSSAPTLPLSSSSSFSSSSVPELTPNRNSSSPPSLPATSDMDIDMHASRPSSAKSGILQIDGSVSIASADDDPEIDTSSGDGDDDGIFNTSLLGPVRFWGESPKTSGLLQPGIELLNLPDSDVEEEDQSPLRDKKGKRKQVSRKQQNALFPPIPTSPTLNLRSKRTTVTPPPSLAAPSTPPPNGQQHQISSIRTPLSHKGLHMSPTASLAHYKSNLDPPPVYGGGHPLDVSQGAEDDTDPMRTPRKRVSNSNTSSIYAPVTPRKLIFPSVGDSPFRTPMGGLSTSPFRTPGSRNIFDPHDPTALLHDELNRMGTAYEDSPGGLFGKGRGSLLYDSPGLDSTPGKWNKWW
ncbi:hypothetical protein B0H34DRAFT_782336 [Crassisporium funariophilum]|nr:hypothetical protein B0H34DRAFT_782336 [Crassisporium funariophilum]